MQQKLAQMLSRLTKIAEEFNVAVYMTNQGNARLLKIFLRSDHFEINKKAQGLLVNHIIVQ